MTDITINRPAARWTAKNPVLGLGQPGFEEDTGKLKIGNGHSKWNELPYIDTPPFVLPSRDTVDAVVSAPLLPQFHGVRYIAYGHSFGQLAGSNTWPGSLYPARLRDLLHADPAFYVNQTQPGTLMDTIAAHAVATWNQGDYGLVSLLGNQNSAGNGQSQAAFQGAVRQFLDHLLHTASPPTILVYKDTTCTAIGYARYGAGSTYGDAAVATYNSWLTDVVDEYPGAPIVVADPLADGWDPAVHCCPDGQHPNDRGSALLAASGIKALAAAPYRLGLNYGLPVVTPPPPPPGALIFADNFDRPDGPVGNGWYAASDQAGWWGISIGQVAKEDGGDSRLLRDDGTADGTVSTTIVNVNDGGLLFRVSEDGESGWLLYPGTAGGRDWQLMKVHPGADYEVIQDFSLHSDAGDVCSVVLSGTSITVYVNGVQRGQVTDDYQSTSTRFGFRGAAGGVLFDNYSHTA